MKIILLLTALVIISCGSNETQQREQLTETQRDSIADRYNNISNMFFQPTEIHRRYKDSAMMTTPKNIEYRQVGSYSYKKKGEHIKAMELLNEAVAHDVAVGSADALEYLAWTYLYYYRDYKRTIQTVNKIDSMTGSRYNVCWGEPCGFLKGQAYYKLGEYGKALNAFKEVNTEEANRGMDSLSNHFLHFYKARSFHEKGDFEQALKSYQLVLKIDDSFSEGLFFLAKLYRKHGHLEEAKQYLDEARHWLMKGKKMSEPYIERFDELFEYMVEEETEKLEAKVKSKLELNF